MADAPFLTTQDVADRFHVSPGTVSRWYRLGFLPAVRLPGIRSHLRFLPADVDAFEAEYLHPEAASA